ncbi:unnamed protein product [Paramecium primaurelia]|uniref:Transmembrane protein n=1 Tax=Paramecium primaurelia TaxID=5886 RepID=A0A8S1L9Z8_PARPR|nr:unnamed protein product [Paramecium primaurelia]
MNLMIIIIIIINQLYFYFGDFLDNFTDDIVLAETYSINLASDITITIAILMKFLIIHFYQTRQMCFLYSYNLNLYIIRRICQITFCINFGSFLNVVLIIILLKQKQLFSNRPNLERLIMNLISIATDLYKMKYICQSFFGQLV